MLNGERQNPFVSCLFNVSFTHNTYLTSPLPFPLWIAQCNAWHCGGFGRKGGWCGRSLGSVDSVFSGSTWICTGVVFPFLSPLLSSQVLQGSAQAIEHPQNALELANGHRVRALASFHDKQFMA